MEDISIKISVLIPVYNAENYLKKCIDSVLNQVYKNLDIIIVNDGSTDSSQKIIDEYAIIDNRIIVIQKTNGGIGSAYKAAFEVMTGDYISFIDSDDYVVPNYYDEIIQIILNQNPDIVHFGRVLFNYENVVTDTLKRYNETINGNEAILDHHFSSLKDPSLACRVFKKELFENVTLFDQNIGIDELLIVQILVKTQKIVFTDKVYYYTYERQDSVSRIEYSELKIKQGIRIYRFICEFIRAQKPLYAKYLEVKYLNYLMPLYEMEYDNPIMSQDILTSLETDIKKYYNLSKNTNEYKSLPNLFLVKVKAFIISKSLFSTLLKTIKYKKKFLNPSKNK